MASCYHTPEDFRETWLEILKFAKEAGCSEKDLTNVIVPVCVRSLFEAYNVARNFTAEYIDNLAWGKSNVKIFQRNGQRLRGADQALQASWCREVEFLQCYYDLETLEEVGKEVLPHFIKK